MSKPWNDSDIGAACRRAWDASLDVTRGPDPEAVIHVLSAFDGSAAEKLRWFAIWLEENVVPDWTVIQGLYGEAVRRDLGDIAYSERFRRELKGVRIGRGR